MDEYKLRKLANFLHSYWNQDFASDGDVIKEVFAEGQQEYLLEITDLMNDFIESNISYDEKRIYIKTNVERKFNKDEIVWFSDVLDKISNFVV